MLGKPEWFGRRKYGGWGIIPKTWQGWIYIVVLFMPFIVFQSLPYWDTMTRIYVTAAWLLFLLFDVSHIMVKMKKDEMESRIESIAERNAAWVMVMFIIAGILYQGITSALNKTFNVDVFLIAALFGGLIAKATSNIYLERKGV